MNIKPNYTKEKVENFFPVSGPGSRSKGRVLKGRAPLSRRLHRERETGTRSLGFVLSS